MVPVASIYRVGTVFASPALYRMPGPGYRQFDSSYVRPAPGACVVISQRPNTVNNYAAIDATPAVLAAGVASPGLAELRLP